MRFTRITQVLLSIGIMGVAVTLVAPSAAQAGSPAVTDSAQAAAQASQCAHPLAQRVGAWVCGDITPAKASAIQTQARADLSKAAPGALTSGTCNASGCWNTYNSYSSDFSGSGWYGYGSTSLGNINWYFDATYTGFAELSKPVWFRSTRGVSSLVFTGDRLYISASYPGGNPVNGGASYRTYPYGSSSANVTAYWNGGYGSYENTVQWTTIVHEVSWRDPSSSYPGQWYFYAKSVKALRNSGGYTFQGLSLPASPTGSGWKP